MTFSPLRINIIARRGTDVKMLENRIFCMSVWGINKLYYVIKVFYIYVLNTTIRFKGVVEKVTETIKINVFDITVIIRD